jgi:hypothetical protein
MPAVLTALEAEAAEAWVLCMQRCTPLDRRAIAVAAMGDLGNLQIVRCTVHADPLSMTYSEAYRHVVNAAEPCALYADLSGCEVQS